VVFHQGNAGCDRVCRRRSADADADRRSRIHQGADFASEETEKPKVNFEVGETIKINNGPFLNFSGVIEEIEPERGKLKVTVNIFGRNTPVELEYWQVEKA
jgi:transcription antitermination factor NusG